MNDVSLLLADIEKGNNAAADQLLPLVYDELRRLATASLARERPGITLQATALVHEAWLKLVGGEARDFANRRHFFAAAAEAMRRILIDQARRKLAIRHGGDRQRLDELPELADPHPALELPLEAGELIEELGAAYPRQADVFKMRLFLQMTFGEIGEIFGLSADSAENDWAFARAWLKRTYQTL